MPTKRRGGSRRLSAAVWIALLASSAGCAKTVCEILLEEQTTNGCGPQGGAGGKAPQSCEGDVEKLARCQIDETEDACRPTGAEQLEVDACVVAE